MLFLFNQNIIFNFCVVSYKFNMKLGSQQLALNCYLIDLHSLHSIKQIIAKKRILRRKLSRPIYEHFVVRLIIHVWFIWEKAVCYCMFICWIERVLDSPKKRCAQITRLYHFLCSQFVRSFVSFSRVVTFTGISHLSSLYKR